MNRTSQGMLQDVFSDQERRNLFLLLTYLYVPRAVRMPGDLARSPLRAVYLLLLPGGPRIALVKGSLNVVHQFAQPCAAHPERGDCYFQVTCIRMEAYA